MGGMSPGTGRHCLPVPHWQGCGPHGTLERMADHVHAHQPLPRRGRQRRVVHGMVAMLAVGLLLHGCAHKPRTYRVGILAGLQVFYSTVYGFKARMAELGYVEGKNIVFDLRETNAEPELERHALKEFVADGVDLVLAFPSEQAVLAKEITRGTGIPLVFCQTNIEGTDLVRSVREPGGNITGVRYPGPDLAVKRFEVLHQLVPRARRFWVPYSKTSQIVPDQLAVLRPAAEKAGVTLVEVPAASPDEIEADLRSRARAKDPGIDAILFISEPFARTPTLYPRIGRFAAERRIPIGGVQYSLQGYTTLFGVATDNLVVGRLAAQQADKVLKGRPAGTIPVVSAESYFQLNITVAEQLGITVPESLLKQADQLLR
jgi:putative tryptophan/tyrosine transport system substrate-binding protein